MNTRSWILGAVATVTGIVAAQAQVTIGYNFGVGSGSLAASSGTPVNFSIGSFSIANTVGSLGTNPNNTAPVSNQSGASGNFNYDNVAPTGAFAINTSGYYSVTITPNAGFAVRVSDFDFGALSIPANDGPVNYALRSSIDSFGADITSGTLTRSATTWTAYNNTFSAVTGTPGAAVTLRLYTYGNTTVTSGVANINLDDVALTAAAVPEGNFSFSRLIIERFIGMASTTPRPARKKIHIATMGQSICRPIGASAVMERSSIAGSAVMVRNPVA